MRGRRKVDSPLLAFGEGAQNARSTVAQAGFPFGGTLVLLTAKRLFTARWAALSVASLAAAIMASANVGFRAGHLTGTPACADLAGFLLLYFALLVPIAVFDFAIPPSPPRWMWLAGAALVAPLAGALDGYYSAAMWSNPGWWVLLNASLMILGGLVAGLLSSRFEGALLPRERIAGATSS